VKISWYGEGFKGVLAAGVSDSVIHDTIEGAASCRLFQGDVASANFILTTKQRFVTKRTSFKEGIQE